MMGQGFVWIIVVEVSLCSKRLDSASMWLDVAGFHGVSLIHHVSGVEKLRYGTAARSP